MKGIDQVEIPDIRCGRFVGHIYWMLEGIGIISDAEIGPDFLSFNVPCIDIEQDVGLVFQLLDQSHFYARIVTGQDTDCMIIKKQLAPKFESELVMKPFNSFKDLGCLLMDVFFVVESFFVVHE